MAGGLLFGGLLFLLRDGKKSLSGIALGFDEAVDTEPSSPILLIGVVLSLVLLVVTGAATVVVLSTPVVVVLLLLRHFGVVLDCIDVLSTPGVVVLMLLLSAISFEVDQLINFECY